MYFKKLTTLLLTVFLLAQLNVFCGGGNDQGDNKAGSDSTSTDSSNASSKKTSMPGRGEQTNYSADIVPVEITEINRGLISDFILLSTNLETEKMASVYSRVQGIVENISSEEGDHVKKKSNTDDFGGG